MRQKSVAQQVLSAFASRKEFCSMILTMQILHSIVVDVIACEPAQSLRMMQRSNEINSCQNRFLILLGMAVQMRRHLMGLKFFKLFFLSIFLHLIIFLPIFLIIINLIFMKWPRNSMQQARVHIFFKNRNVETLQRVEIYKHSDFWLIVGNFFALFFGLSLLFEHVYHNTLRVCSSISRKMKLKNAINPYEPKIINTISIDMPNP